MELSRRKSASFVTTVPVRLTRIEVWACRAPLEEPIETSFGAMVDRPAVFVRLEDGDGAFGFGEIWCNFPGCGAEHRARLLAEEVADLAFACEARHPGDLFHQLSGKVRVRLLQSGEPGPYAQVIAGLDLALWDLFARKAGRPVRRLLNRDAADGVTAYASGIHIGEAESFVPEARQQGYAAFKVKVGFDTASDVAKLNRLAGDLRNGEQLFADANQAWDVAEAARFLDGVKDSGLGWLEEPLAADAPARVWKQLANAHAVPLAAGENIAGREAFEAAIDEGALAVIQPDLAKWGGFTGCLEVARRTLDAGRVYCPHYLGGGIGLLASAHLLAAAGGPGLLEVDYNANPMRQAIWSPPIKEGHLALDDAPGLGITDLPEQLVWLTTYYRELNATTRN